MFDFTPYMPYIYAILAGLVYAAFGYLSKTAQQDFDWKKFVSTLATSLVVVVVLLQSGQAITQAGVEAQMTAYFMLTVIFQKILDAVFRKVETRALTQRARPPQGTTDPAIKFSIQYLGSRITPCDVMFTALTDGITKWSYGDGVFASFDTPGQKTILHTYKIPGTFQIRAFIGWVMSEPMEVTILGIAPNPEPQPVKKSWLEILIAWFFGLFGKK